MERDEHLPWGERFTAPDGCEPWYPILFLEFAYQVKTPEGKPYSPHKKKRRKTVYFRDYKVRTGIFRSYKNATCYRYRSLLEKRWYMVLENDASVVHYFPEPFAIPYRFGNELHRYIPDVLIEFAGGRPVVAEIKPAGQVDEPKNKAKFAAASAWCAERSMEFQVWTRPPEAGFR
jgi:hypothetical protein